MLLVSLLAVVLTSCVLSPIYTQTENDVTVMYTVLPIIIEYAILVFESLYIALLCAITVYSVYAVMKGIENKTVCIVYIVAVVFLKHALNLAVSTIIDGYLDTAFDIPVTVIMFAVDILLLTAVALVARNKCGKHFAHAQKMRKAAKYIETVEYDEKTEIHPFNGFFNIKNPIVFSIFVGSAISVSLLVVQRLYADIFVLGLPGSVAEIIEILIAYTLDILIGLAGYTAAYFASSYMFIKALSKEEQE